jgi:hypothetical protein
MSSAKRNLQKRLAAKAGNIVGGAMSLSPYGIVKGVVGAMAQKLIPQAVTTAGESFATWYYTREYVKSYGAIAGPIILAGTTLTLSQAGQIANIVKSISKAVWRKDVSQPVSTGTQQKYEYAAVIEEKKQVPWEYVALVLSLISLKVPVINPMKIPLSNGVLATPEVRPRRWGMLYLVFRLLMWFGRTWWAGVKSPIGAVLTTRLISKTLASGPLSSSQQRQVFVDTPLVRSVPVENHTHGHSACDRNASSATACLLAQSLGLEPYLVQMSLSDVRKGRDGDRSFHWAKDLAGTPVEFHFDPKKHASVFVDTDEHMDMPHFLAKNPGTHFICTFQPTAAAQGEGEYSFRFLKDNRVQYNVSGGAEYVHHVWDYSGDTIIVEDKSFMQKTVVAYHMDRKAIDDHHCIVMLTLIGRFDIPTLMPTSVCIEGRRLKRLEPVCGNHVVLDVVRQDGLYRSVGILGAHLSVTLLKTRLDAVHAVAITAKSAITPGMVDSNISEPSKNGMPEYKLAPGQAHIIASYLRDGVPLFPPMVYPPSECVIPIWYDKYGSESRIPLSGFGSPLIGPNYVHASDIASENQCISGRVEAFTGRKFQDAIRPTLAGYMSEFARFVVPEGLAGTGAPVGHEEVHDRQDRPSQRSILDQAEMSGPWYKRIFRTFDKIEEYQKITDPRNITTVTPEAKLKNSRFMYAFHDQVMMKLKNYAFNKTPREIAEMIPEILRSATHSVLADGSRFDGHVTRLARILERIIMFRFFRPEWYAELNETLDEQIGLPGVTREGRLYASFYTRGSGTLETSDFNSLLSMFIGYCAWRNTVVDGQKCSPELAWANLGIYGGDDSLEGAVDPKALKKSAELMGQDYEIEVVQRGCRGVNFLNRWFGPDVWTGDCNSMANPKRLLAKLWIGPTNLPNPIERFAERISGYYRMDRNSPVIGKICMVAHELLGSREEGVLMPWDGKHSLESNWPNEDSGWMIDQFVGDIPDFDFDRFEDWIGQIWYERDAGLLLRAPLCTPAVGSVLTSKVVCVAANEMVVPAEPLDPAAKGKEEADTGRVAGNDAAPVEELEDSSSVTEEQVREVSFAEKHVPRVNEKGIKLDPKSTKKVARQPKPDAKPFDRNRPDLWEAPKNASPERMAEWSKLRAKVAKKLGIKLVK